MNWMEEYQAEKRRKAKEARKQAFFLMTELTAEGVKHVYISFSGGGDDGSLNEVLIDEKDVLPSWGSKEKENHPFGERLADWAYLFLDGTGIDWVNNDGGNGTIEFDIEARKIEFTVNQHRMVTEVAAEGEITFGTEGADEDGEEQPLVSEAGTATN